jgi:hypothetical protein
MEFKSKRQEVLYHAQNGVTLDYMINVMGASLTRAGVRNELNLAIRTGKMTVRVVDGTKVYTTIPEEMRVISAPKENIADLVNKIKISAENKNTGTTIEGAPKPKSEKKPKVQDKPEPQPVQAAQPVQPVQPGSLCMGADKTWDLKVTMPDTTVDALMLASQHLKAAGYQAEAQIVRKVAAIMELTHI